MSRDKQKDVPPPPDQPKQNKIKEPEPPKEKSAYFQGTDRTDSSLASEEDE